MLFVTLHGGDPKKNPHKNNVHAYGKHGKLITPCVLDKIKNVSLDELRAIRRSGKYLYVVNANKKQNNVFAFRGSGTRCKFVGRFVSRKTCAGVVHPFDLTFDGAGYCYLSSQDTNVVIRLKVSANGGKATPAPIAPALRGLGKFWPGTFVASSVGNLVRKCPTTPVSAPQGLSYAVRGKKKHSVRGVLWANNALYVADQPAGQIKIYDRAGKLLGQSNRVKSPVHLIVHRNSLFVSGANQVFMARLSKPAGNFTLSPIPGLRVKNGGGMAFTPSGHFYIASRTKDRIRKFDAEFKAMKFKCSPPDDPEFLLHM